MGHLILLVEVEIRSIAVLICLCRLTGSGVILWFPSFSIKRKTFVASILNLAELWRSRAAPLHSFQ